MENKQLQVSGNVSGKVLVQLKASGWANSREGWKNFKREFPKIQVHLDSAMHKLKVGALSIEWDKAVVEVKLDEHLLEEQKGNGKALKAIFCAIRLCGVQGVARRSHGDESQTANVLQTVPIMASFLCQLGQNLTHF